jgi:uroporphyrinogen-III synthase
MRVVVTRPESEARRWLEDLRARGFDALPLSLIDIAPVPQPAALHAAWRGLAQVQSVMFVSGNAVREFFAHRPDGAVWPAATRAWATGNGTRDALFQAGIPASLVDAPPESSAQFDSETLWLHVRRQIAKGSAVMIVRGGDADGAAVGRDWLATQLHDAGARVETVVAYVRQAPVWSEAQRQQARDSTGTGSAWLFSSSQAVAHLQGLLPGQDWSQARAVATHPRIARAARDCGFGVVCESRPTVDAVVAALESFR